MKPSEIDKVRLPFSLYDFFGYLMPGATFVGLIFFSRDLMAFYSIVFNSHDFMTHQLVFPRVLVLLEASPITSFILSIIIAYVIGHVLSSLSSFVLERFIVELWLKWPAVNLFSHKSNAYLFKKYRRPYNSSFQDVFVSTFKKRFDIAEPMPHELFWLSFEEIALRAPAAFARTTHFLNLYGFSRTLSLAFFIAALFNSLFSVKLAILYLIISVLLFWNYLKLLRRLNDEVFRAFYTVETGSHSA